MRGTDTQTDTDRHGLVYVKFVKVLRIRKQQEQTKKRKWFYVLVQEPFDRLLVLGETNQNTQEVKKNAI